MRSLNLSSVDCWSQIQFKLLILNPSIISNNSNRILILIPLLHSSMRNYVTFTTIFNQFTIGYNGFLMFSLLSIIFHVDTGSTDGQNVRNKTFSTKLAVVFASKKFLHSQNIPFTLVVDVHFFSSNRYFEECTSRGFSWIALLATATFTTITSRSATLSSLC